jgi:hypothetical protein
VKEKSFHSNLTGMALVGNLITWGRRKNVEFRKCGRLFLTLEFHPAVPGQCHEHSTIMFMQIPNGFDVSV